MSVSAPAFYTEYVTVAPDTAVTFETTALSSGADPVMHLLQIQADGSYLQVAYNDNWVGGAPPPAPPPANLNAKVTYLNSGITRRYLLVIRAKSAATIGTCQVNLNGVVRQDTVPVGAPLVALANWAYSVGDDMRTVHQPGQSVAPALITFPAIPNTILSTGLGNAVAKTSRVSLAADAVWVLVGTPQVRVNETGYFTYRAGSTVVMANDTANDPDADGVGSALEAALGTCSSVASCGSGAVGGYDTDRDGLSDGEEIWGVAGTLPMGVDDLAFARYGANPRKKDVFIEVDHMYDFGSPVPAGYNPFRWMQQNPTTPLVDDLGTPEQWMDKLREPYMAAPAAQIKNPNGENGLEIHADLGVPPTNLADESKFGSWSTAAARVVVPDFVVRVNMPINGNVTVEINNESTNFDATGLDVGQIAASIGFAVGAFLHQPVAVKDFVDTGIYAQITFEAQQPGIYFSRSLTLPAGSAGAAVLPEGNGSLWDQYKNDPGQVDTVRRGRMRYAIATGANGGGQTDGARFVTGLALLTFAHELGHSLGLSHWGHSDWGKDPVSQANTGIKSDCPPAYYSLMGYGYRPYLFSQSVAGMSLNPARTQESETFGSSFDHSFYTGVPYQYEAPTGFSGVDWNRDQFLAPANTKWRSFAMDVAGGDCSAFAMGRDNLYPTNPSTIVGAPDLVRYGDRLYAFWSKNTVILYQFATLGAPGSKSCTGSDNPFDKQAAKCLTWSPTTQAYFSEGDPFRGVSALSKDGSLFLAVNTASGQMHVVRYEATTDGYLSPKQLDTLGSPSDNAQVTSGLPQDAPELTIRNSAVGGGTVTLLYLAADHVFRSYDFDPPGWTYQGALQDPSGGHISGMAAPAAKAWPDNEGAGWLAAERMTLALLPDNNAHIRVFALDFATNQWRNLGIDPSPNYGTVGKPFLEYRTARAEAGLPNDGKQGNFMIGWMEYSAGLGARAAVRVAEPCDRYHPPMAAGIPQLALTPLIDKLQNRWATTQVDSSAALFSDTTIDNVFGIVPLQTQEMTGVVFYPHADGAPDAPSTIYSDFAVMEDYVCWNLAKYRAINGVPVDPTAFCATADVFN